ncbi:S-layer homology domain-containing protein [Paenibacillus assamensis]|uniref:S-layer homology domain-containing protein n=1 Tax=Paenibacillus assamensis TaxID=311244 RepID=UPI0004214194|nr:S-layer homology domain-containing protein [Paenibacillus assamensis]
MVNQTRKPIRIATSAILALSLTMSTVPAALAAEAASTATKVNTTGFSPMFSDLKSGHWGEAHIHKLAALGILKGYNGKFRPDDPVTQQEAITIALQYMNVKSELPNADEVVLPEGIKVGNHFKPYAALAIQKGLINKTEEVAALDPKAKGTWGEQKATREWVTKILVRAMGKDADAQEAMKQETTFADNGDISANALGYVNVATHLKLATGMDKNRFLPKNNVTRAQIASFFSRGESVLDIQYANEYHGISGGITDSSIRLFNQDNQWVNYRVDAKTVYYSNAKPIAPKDIPAYTKVRVIGEANNAAYVELIDAAPQVETVQATLKYVVPSENKLYLKVAGSEDLQQVKYEQNTILKDASGNTITVDKLTADSELTIMRETFSEDRRVLEIQVKSGPVNKSGKGSITEINKTTRNVTVKLDNGASETFRVDEQAVVSYANQLFKFEDLKVNDPITFTVKNSVITGITLNSSPSYTIDGKIQAMGPAKTSITILKDDNRLEAKMIARNVEVVINGMKHTSVDNLLAGEYGDRVKLTIDGEDKVTRIEVLSRKVETLIGAQVEYYNAEKKLLTVIADNIGVKSFYLTDDTKYELDGNSIIGAAVIPMLNGKRKVNIQFTGDKVLLVSFAHKYEGTIVNVSTSSRTITLKLANEQIITIPYSTNLFVVDVYGKSSATLADVKPGNEVTVVLSQDQASAMSMSVRTNKQFEIAGVNSSNGRVTLRDTSRQVEEHSVLSVPVYGFNNEKLSVSDLRPDDVVNAVFNGRSLVELRKVAVNTGRIEAIDASAGIVTIKDYKGQTSTHPINNGVTVIAANGTTSNSAAALQVGERIEIRKDANNATVLKVMAGEKHNFWKYDANTKELFVQRTSVSGSQPRLIVLPEALVHSKGQTLNWSSFKNGDSITIYLMNGKVVEVEKN